MTQRPYPAYQESNFEWVGRLPNHWKLIRLKNALRLRTEKTDRRTNAVALENIEGWSGRRIDTETEFSGDGVAFETGDLLFGKLRPYLAKVLLADAPGEAVGDFHVLSPAEQTLGRFAQYQILNRDFISVLDGSTYGAKMPRVSWDFMANMPFAFPPLPEQAAIAAFLDRETAKIDALVEEQKRLIELLKEKRQAVISHAVTKGLNPDARMKDSGIEWLGEVPEHWEVKALKRIAPKITVGIVVNPSNYVSDEGLPFIYGGDIEEGRINFNNSRRITEADSYANEKTRLAPGDLLTVRVGAPGVTAVVPEECDGGNCASVMLVRRGAFSSEWLCYAMNSRILRYQVELVQYGAAQEQFNISHAVEFLVPTPPFAEQVEIGESLHKQIAALGALTEQAKQSISLLNERRSALISAAVTGKIDVRGIVDVEDAA